MAAPSGTEQQRDRVSGHEKHSYQGPGRLAAKTAVITRAGSGIGEAAAFAFAREGAADEAAVSSMWLGAGLADWYLHRRTHIEDTAETGVPVLLGLFC